MVQSIRLNKLGVESRKCPVAVKKHNRQVREKREKVKNKPNMYVQDIMSRLSRKTRPGTRWDLAKKRKEKR